MEATVLGSVQRDAGRLNLQTSAGTLEISALAPHILRVVLNKSSRSDYYSYLLEQSFPGEALEEWEGKSSWWRASTAAIQIKTTPLRLGFSDRSLHASLSNATIERLAGGRFTVSFLLPREHHFFGLGHGGEGLDRLGVCRQLWNSHAPHGRGSDIAVPLILCNVGYGLFFDNTSDGSVTAGRTDNGTRLVFEFDGGPLDFYYFACESPRSALATAAHLLGTPLLPPRWSLGFLQSTRHFESDNELRRLSSEIRERNFPCDALIFLSTYSDALGWNRQVGLLDFEPSLWRDPPTLLEEMKERHFHVITHEYPVLHPTSPDFSEAERMGYLLSDGYPNLSPADRAPASYQQGQRYIDFSHSEARRWWWRRHRQLCELGISGWWLDGGEGPRRTTRMAAGEGRDLHNVYDLLRIRAFAEGESEDRQDLRPFMVCRSGGPGMHRYGAWCWSGDIDNTFEVLEQQVQLGLSAAMSGIVFWGTDIGGFFHAVPESAELYTRWFQFGAFCPLFRAHGRIWREHLPWAHGEQVEEICRRYAELRYQLLPYTYTLAWQAHSTGLPLMRPLCLNNPNDPRAWDECHEYLWGDDILVAPVTREGARHCAVYLPEGGWYDYWTQLRYEGGRGVEVEAPLERLPLFVREGGIIPMSQIKQYDDGRPVEEVTLLIYPVRSRGASAQFDLYEDDGASNGYRRGDFAVSRIECARGLDGTVRLSVSPPEGNALLLPRNRSYLAKVHMPRPRKVSVHDAGTSVEWSFENGFLFFRLAGSVMSVVILPS